MGTTGATFARFGFGFPFIALLAALLPGLTGASAPAPNGAFLIAVTVCGVSQIGATFLLVHLFSLRNFMVGTAYSKTEAIQAALFGLVILGEAVTGAGLAAILVGLCGVLLLSVGGTGAMQRPSLRQVLLSRAAWIGILSGALFAIAAVAARWAALSLETGEPFMRAVTALAYVTGFQTVLMLAYMALFDRAELVAIRRAWLPSLLVGIAGISASTGWFTAMTLQTVAYVRALGQVELVFTYLSSVLIFGERVRPVELVGCALILVSILLLLGVLA